MIYYWCAVAGLAVTVMGFYNVVMGLRFVLAAIKALQ